MNSARLRVSVEGGGYVLVALDEAAYLTSRGSWIMAIPVVRYDEDGNWVDGSHVYTTFDFDGVVDEVRYWAHTGVRTAHNTGEGA